MPLISDHLLSESVTCSMSLNGKYISKSAAGHSSPKNACSRMLPLTTLFWCAFRKLDRRGKLLAYLWRSLFRFLFRMVRTKIGSLILLLKSWMTFVSAHNVSTLSMYSQIVCFAEMIALILTDIIFLLFDWRFVNWFLIMAKADNGKCLLDVCERLRCCCSVEMLLLLTSSQNKQPQLIARWLHLNKW